MKHEIVKSIRAKNGGSRMDVKQFEIRIPYPMDDATQKTIQQLCKSKVDEFELLGYQNVYAQDIWDCVSEKYIPYEWPALYRITNDILSLKSTTFMNWLALFVIKES